MATDRAPPRPSVEAGSTTAGEPTVASGSERLATAAGEATTAVADAWALAARSAPADG